MPPRFARAVFQHVGQAEGEEQAVKRITAIKRPDQAAFYEEAEQGGKNRSEDQRPPEAHVKNQYIGQVGADREKSAMSEIDHPGKIRINDRPTAIKA